MGGNVEVVRRDGKTFQADPINVAVESGFYDLPDGEGGTTQVMEDFFEASWRSSRARSCSCGRREARRPAGQVADGGGSRP